MTDLLLEGQKVMNKQDVDVEEEQNIEEYNIIYLIPHVQVITHTD